MNVTEAHVAPTDDRYYEDYAVGQRFESGGRTLTDADIRMYLGATGTDHPNHSDAEYCRRHAILEGICAPGVLVLGYLDAFTTSTITRYMASSMHYGHDKIRYVNPVYVGDTLHAEMTVAECEVKDDTWGLIRLDQRAVNQRGDVVLHNLDVLIVQRRSSAAP